MFTQGQCNTIKHSSRTRTVRCSGIPGGGVVSEQGRMSAQGGNVCLGVSAWGCLPGGVCLGGVYLRGVCLGVSALGGWLPRVWSGQRWGVCLGSV